MTAETFHREADSVLEVFVNSSLSAAFFCVCDNFIEEALVSAFAEVFHDSREEPECIVSTIRRVTCFLSVNAVLVVLVRAGLVTCVVVELDKWETAAVAYLSREHKAYLFSSHFRVKVNDTLYILNCIAVAVAVSQTAVNE